MSRPGAPRSIRRRGFIAGATALAATGLATPVDAQPKPRCIDVHHHLVAPTWLDALKSARLDTPPMRDWTPQHSIDDLDQAGVATAILSPTTPQVSFLPRDAAVRITRESNDYARRLTIDHPGRFGMFAMLPMPHVDESLKEIEYALDALKANGIGMMTSYSDKWLGYPEFAPVFDELNRRKATVYTHPTGANCCVNLVQGVPEQTVEYGTDTTRTIASLIFSGASQRYKDINFIFSHGGGVLTAVAERFEIQMVNTLPYKGKFTREIVDHELRRFYYDTAQIANAVTLDALAKLVPTSQIVFGTDYPYRTAAEHVAGLAKAFRGPTLGAIERDNALRILPDLTTA
ncbi:MAG TPA: amidohydrolase family protein [Acetobacteraceae bacterium]|jgi:predicted TIM-barrel fold metal-dependent hydrolase|nr:amidohydrolase family protein [Acetobacteraceae bacterium]